MSGRVRPGEQITKRSPSANREADPAAVLRPVMKQVAPLAQRFDVAVSPPAMRRVMVEMRRRQHHPGGTGQLSLGQGGRGDPAAATVPPGLTSLVPPPAVAEMADRSAMRPAA